MKSLSILVACWAVAAATLFLFALQEHRLHVPAWRRVFEAMLWVVVLLAGTAALLSFILSPRPL